MAVLDSSADSNAVRGVGAAPLARLARTVSAALKAWRNRGDFGRLREMADWELADIGLRREDLANAWARRAELDPTRCLGMTAHARGAAASARRLP